MDERVTFTVLRGEKYNDDFEKLKRLLSSIGVTVEMYDLHLAQSDDYSSLSFHWNQDEFEKKIKRNAGRKCSVAKWKYTVSDVKEMIREKGATEAAKEIGLSRQRLYARLKTAEENNSYYF